MVEHILCKEAELVKEHVENNIEELDLREMIKHEEQTRNRDELVLWLLQKEQRRSLIKDEERVKELLSHIEHAYNTAAISEQTYAHAKQVNRELLENN